MSGRRDRRLLVQRRARAVALSQDAAAADALQQLVWTIGLAVLVLAGVATLYVAKSVLGVDLMPGPSPLHDWLWPLAKMMR